MFAPLWQTHSPLYKATLGVIAVLPAQRQNDFGFE